MSALGSLVVRLSLAHAEYTQGLDRASQDSLRFAKNVQDGMDKAKRSASDFLGGVVSGAVGAVATLLSVGAVVHQVSSAIDRLDALNDLSARIGVPKQQLQELAYAGKFADVSMESLATGVKKLSQSM